MEDSFWSEWLDMKQTKAFVQLLEKAMSEKLTSSMSHAPEKRSDIISEAIGISDTIRIIENLKEE